MLLNASNMIALVALTAYAVRGQHGPPPPPQLDNQFHQPPPPAFGNQHGNHHRFHERHGGQGGQGGQGQQGGQDGFGNQHDQVQGRQGWFGNQHDNFGGSHNQWDSGRQWQPAEIFQGFDSCRGRIVNFGPNFENACQDNHPEVLISGLADIRISIVSLSAQVHASLGAWGSSDINTCANQYVSLLSQVQGLLQIIHTHGRLDSCQDAISGLNVPFQALSSAFVGAGINLRGALGAHVNLGLLGSIGVHIGISV